jgi:hypothetical protein
MEFLVAISTSKIFCWEFGIELYKGIGMLTGAVPLKFCNEQYSITTLYDLREQQLQSVYVQAYSQHSVKNPLEIKPPIPLEQQLT